MSDSFLCVCVCVCGVVCEDARGEGDGKSSEVNAGTPLPSKKMKDGNKPDEPIEGQSSNFEFKLKTQFHVCILVVVETDRVVLAPPTTSVARETKKKSVRIAESEPVSMETESVVSHHSHSTTHGQVCLY